MFDMFDMYLYIYICIVVLFSFSVRIDLICCPLKSLSFSNMNYFDFLLYNTKYILFKVYIN